MARGRSWEGGGMPARRDGGPVHEKDGAARARRAVPRAREGRRGDVYCVALHLY